MTRFDRRQFVRRSALAAAAFGPGFVRGGDPSERISVAVVGVRGRGMSAVGGFAGKNNCVVTAICDCDEAVIGPAMTKARDAQGSAPRYEKDVRRLLEDKAIDVVSIATPNHWHALMAVWAMQAGKDVYVEKPVSHNVWEGRKIVEAARKYGKICQYGVQSRSNPGMREAIEFVRTGGVGKVTVARGICYRNRPSIGTAGGPRPVPATVDYDLWCGPAPKRPLARKNLHYDWHWVWNTGNGDLGNQGIHEMDKARWGLGKDALPTTAFSVGGRFGYADDGETANTQVCVFDYGDAKLIFEVRGLGTKPYLDTKVGNVFHGTEGYVVCPDYKSGTAYRPDGSVIRRWSGGADQLHYDNFVKAVRSRRREEQHAEVLDGHLSSALCHLGNVSMRLGTLTSMAAPLRSLGVDRDTADALARMAEHLGENKVELDRAEGRVGALLRIDPMSETVVGNPRANEMLSREYRKGFEVPERV